MKILHVIRSLDFGGMQSNLLNIVKNSDKRFEHILLCYKGEDLSLASDFEKLGVSIIFINKPSFLRINKYKKELASVLNENEFDAVHVHSHYLFYLPLKIAFKNNISIRITHSHTADYFNNKNLIYKIYYYISKRIIKKYSTQKIACSKASGYALYDNNDFEVINNAIDIDKFTFNSTSRIKLRNELNIGSEFVIGHVGRFDDNKNQAFLIDVLSNLVNKNLNVKFILIGEGYLKDAIYEKIKENNLEKHVIIIPPLRNVEEYYNAFDLFLFPSYSEGLGMVLIEALINGLNAIVSDTITKETNITGNVKYLDLDINKWIDEIENFIKKDKRNNIDEHITNKYNIKHEIKKLESIYSGEINAILTFHYKNNFGAVLQAFALTEVLSRYKMTKILDFRFKENKNIKMYLRYIVLAPFRLIRNIKYKSFYKKYYKLTERINTKNISYKTNNYKNIIVGSDQVWNKEITHKYEDIFLLNFNTSANKNSYAASIGKNDLNSELIEKIKSSIIDYKNVSVREQTSFLEDNIDIVLDPTLLLNKNEWISLLNIEDKPSDYILIYMVEKNEDLINIANYLKNKTNLKIIGFNSKNYFGKNYSRKLFASPKDFITLVRNAKYVVTNSFHGVALSVIFEKEFIASPHQSRNIRIENLLSILELSKRMTKFNRESVDNLIKENIDYKRVNKILEKSRINSLKFIEKIIK